MTILLGYTDFAVIACMLGVSASIGLYYRFTGGRQRTTEEFLMASRSGTAFPVAFSIMATYMSAIAMLGNSAEAYVYGSQLMLRSLSAMLWAVIVAYGIIPVYFDANVATVYEYLVKRFGKATRMICSILFTVQTMLYMSVVLYAPAIALNAVSGLSFWASIIVLAIVCTVYCFLGGMKAVIWTDVFQASLMFITIIIILVAACINVGGVQEMFKIANEGGRLIFTDTSTDLNSRYTVWNTIIFGILFTMSFVGINQTQVQRILITGNVKTGQKAIIAGIFLFAIFDLLTMMSGVAIYSNVYSCDPLKMKFITSQDQLVPYFIVQNLRHFPGLAGLCVAGIFSGSLSTMSSAMNSMAMVTIEDFIKPYCFCKRLRDTWTIILAKIIVLFYGGLCLLLAIGVAKFRGVSEASIIFVALVGGPMLGIFMLGMMTKTANEIGTLIGFFFGFSLNAWMSFGSFISNIKVPRLPQSTKDCPVYLNTTNSLFNETWLNSTLIPVDGSDLHEEVENDVLPIYKVSYMWFVTIGFSVVFIVGYVSSFVINCFKVPNDHNPKLFSPFVRKWFFPEKNEKNNVSLKLRKAQPNNSIDFSNGHEQNDTTK